MKRKVALFACGWSTDYVCSVMKGIEQAANEHGMDIYMFTNYASYGDSEKELEIETAIYHLPDLADFDGAIILGNILNSFNENERLQQEIRKCKIPALYLQYECPDIPNLRTDNETGMHELMQHILTEHKPKYPVFMSGPANHQESDLRKSIFTEECTKAGLILSDKNYLQGNWTETTAELLTAKLLAESETIPDAIICANDNMAFGVIGALEDAGIKVPDQILVTGYDAINDGFYVDPILTSVSSNSVALGEKAIELIDDLIHGLEVPHETVLKSKVEIRQSCGCCYEPTPEIKKMITRSSLHYQRTTQMATDMYFRTLYLCVREVENIHWLHYALKYFYSTKKAIEGEEFAICLQPDFDAPGIPDSKEYSRRPNLIYARFKNETTYQMDFDMFPTLFNIAANEEDSQIFMFLPMQTSGYPIGYAIFHWNPDLLDNFFLYTWEKHFSQNLDLIKHNLKICNLNEELKRLSYTDTLTGVYSRIGCDDLAATMLKDLAEKNQHCVVIMADLDKMKNINDLYGHTQGDFSLRILSTSFTQACPEGYIIARFGGDEFLITGPCEKDFDLEAFIRHLEEIIEENVEKAILPYHLTASIGGFIKDPKEELTFEQCIERADSFMYRIKKEHHKRP